MHLLVIDTLRKRSGRGSENQSVSGVTTICLMQRDISPLNRVDQVVNCGLWNVVPLFNCCVKLLDIGRNWNTVVHVDPGHPKNAQWVTCLVSMQAEEELGHFHLPGIVYISLRHGAMQHHVVMAADEWHDSGPQDLNMVFLCIQIAIIVVCSLCLPIP